jgi:O-antigen/teichoic acid export membrane protein
MFVMMFVSLFTSRILLDVLGITDYGIYNIVSGVVALFAFINNALSFATQRFLNFYLGKQDYISARMMFCMSLNTYILLSVVVLILGETIGLWFVQTQLNIPAERLSVALWVYQFSIVNFIVSLLGIPYNATIIAYEKMDFYAYVSLADVFLKLVLVYFLYITTFDKLIVYSLYFTILTIISNFVYKIYCNRKFSITHYYIGWDKKKFQKLFSFTGWSLFGSLANLSAQQGVSILINIYHGVSVNAAVGIAGQVAGTVYRFISNFQTAFNPQIVKSYASNSYTDFYKLIFQTSRFSYFMVVVLFTPIMLTIDNILSVWLTVVPEYSAVFCRLILIFSAIEAASAPLWMGVHATGKIRNYQLMVAIIIGLNFPFSYVVLSMGFPPYSVLWGRILMNVLTWVARCLYMRLTMNFPLGSYLKQVIVPIICVTLLSIPIPLFVNMTVTTLWPNLISVGLVSVIVTVILIYYVGMTKSERELVKNIAKNKLVVKRWI